MRVTFQQGRGRWNKEYWTAIFWWDKADKHVFHRRAKEDSNWMPKHDEIELLLTSLLQVEAPEKREELRMRFSDAIGRGMAAPVSFNGSVAEPK